MEHIFEQKPALFLLQSGIAQEQNRYENGSDFFLVPNTSYSIMVEFPNFPIPTNELFKFNFLYT